MNALRSARSLDTRTWEDALKRATAITKMEDMFEENGRLEWKLPRRFRAMALLCRETALPNLTGAWLLAEAEYWEHLAAAALAH